MLTAGTFLHGMVSLLAGGMYGRGAPTTPVTLSPLGNLLDAGRGPGRDSVSSCSTLPCPHDGKFLESPSTVPWTHRPQASHPRRSFLRGTGADTGVVRLVRRLPRHHAGQLQWKGIREPFALLRRPPFPGSSLEEKLPLSSGLRGTQ